MNRSPLLNSRYCLEPYDLDHRSPMRRSALAPSPYISWFRLLSSYFVLDGGMRNCHIADAH
jgi:hypothetical protein